MASDAARRLWCGDCASSSSLAMSSHPLSSSITPLGSAPAWPASPLNMQTPRPMQSWSGPPNLSALQRVDMTRHTGTARDARTARGATGLVRQALGDEDEVGAVAGSAIGCTPSVVSSARQQVLEGRRALQELRIRNETIAGTSRGRSSPERQERQERLERQERQEGRQLGEHRRQLAAHHAGADAELRT